MTPLIAFILVPPKIYEVNTITMSEQDECLNPALGLRNDLFGIKACGETMIWEVDSSNPTERVGNILHCQRYEEQSFILKGHIEIITRLVKGDTSFFQGDGFH